MGLIHHARVLQCKMFLVSASSNAGVRFPSGSFQCSDGDFALPYADTYLPTSSEPGDMEQLNAALGFALLQWERRAVSCDRLQLSEKPEWAVLCFNMLQLLLPMSGASPDQRDYVIFHYLLDKVRCCPAALQRVQCMQCGNAGPCSQRL